MADLAHINMESNGNGAPPLPFGSTAAELKESIGKNHDKTKSLIHQMTGFSGTLETVLLSLLHNQDILEKSMASYKHDCKQAVDQVQQVVQQENQSREAAGKELKDLLTDGLQKVTGDLEGKVDGLKAEISELGEEQSTNQKAVCGNIDRLTNTLNDKIDANLAEVAKLVNGESERICARAGKAESDFKDELSSLKTEVANIESDIVAKAQGGSDDQLRQMSEIKMAIEEEKMLRGQDNEILKLNLQQGVTDLTNQFEEHKQAVDKITEEEKEERNSQYDDMINRVDKEKRDRSQGLSDLETRTDENLKQVSDKEHESETSVLKEITNCRDSCKAAIEKAQTDLDELNNVTIERINSVKSGLESKIQDEAKERADIIKDTLTGIETEIINVKDLIHKDKTCWEEAVQEQEDTTKKGIAELEDRVGDIFKGLCETVKTEMDTNKTSLEALLNHENEERKTADDQLLEKVEKNRGDMIDEIEEKDRLQGQKTNDLLSKFATLEEVGTQGVELLREEVQKEKKTLEQQGELLNSLVNGAVPACETKIADLATQTQQEKLDRKADSENLKQVMEKDKQDLLESIEKEHVNVYDKMDQQNDKLLQKLSEETTSLNTSIERGAQEQKQEAALLHDKIKQESKMIDSRLEDETKTLKKFAESCKEAALNEAGKISETGKQEVKHIQEQLEKDKEELLNKLENQRSDMTDIITNDHQSLEEKFLSETTSIRNKVDKERDLLKETQDRLEKEMTKVEFGLTEQIKTETNALSQKLSNAVEDQKKKDELLLTQLEESQQGSKHETSNLVEKLSRDIAGFEEGTKELSALIASEKDNRRKEVSNVKAALQDELKEIKQEVGQGQESIKGLINSELQDIKASFDKESKSLQENIVKVEKGTEKVMSAVTKQLEEDRDNLGEKLLQVSDDIHSTLKTNFDMVGDSVKKANGELKMLASDLDVKLEGQKSEFNEKIGNERKELQEIVESDIKKIERDSEDLRKKVANDKLDLSRRTDEVAQDLEKEKVQLSQRCGQLAQEKQELQHQCDGLQKENSQRKEESNEVRRLLAEEMDKMPKVLSKNNADIMSQMHKEMERCREELAQQAKDVDNAKKNMQQHQDTNCNKFGTIEKTVQSLSQSSSLPLSVCFNAIREEAYIGGGEEFLTFSSCTVNAGKGMDAKSGVFTAPVEGVYFFTLNVCSHDMKKILVAIRRNGEEIASVYDQNHLDNHRNSMAGQICLTHLNVGDKVQVYMYTFTGIFDKAANHLTQFCGFLMRPT
jgi:hypothetical protein